MKFIHTADWHLGKLVQGVHMTEDQRFVFQQLLEVIQKEKPDAVVIAGDIYDRAVPPIEAIALFNELIETIVIQLETPVLAIAGNHDSPNRLHFGSRLMSSNGFHIVGRVCAQHEPVILQDEHGEVHFHLVPFADPTIVREVFQEEAIITHQDAMQTIVQNIEGILSPTARHVFVGHAFLTPAGEEASNTSDSERPLAIGGVEHVAATLFERFHYTALGHLHQAHYVLNETIRYAGSPLKYSISEEHHEKGFYIVELDAEGNVRVEKQVLKARRDMRTVKGTIDELLTHTVNEDYVFVQLQDQLNVLHPMEKMRSVYPNAMHISRETSKEISSSNFNQTVERKQQDDIQLFQSFYEQLLGERADEEIEAIFLSAFDKMLQKEEVTQ